MGDTKASDSRRTLDVSLLKERSFSSVVGVRSSGAVWIFPSLMIIGIPQGSLQEILALDHFSRGDGSEEREELRVCEEIIWTLWRERRAGRCEAPRRRRCRTSSRSGNNAGTAPGIARRSRLASGPGGQQQSVHIISSQTLSLRPE